MRPDDSLEQAARKRGYALVCGCDEAGAGPLMGPVCAGAVILPEGFRPHLHHLQHHRLLRTAGYS